MIGFTEAYVLGVPRYPDDLSQRSVELLLHPQVFAERVFVRPEIPRGRFTHDDDRCPDLRFPFGKSTAANDRNTNGFEVVRRDRIPGGGSGPAIRTRFSGQSNRRVLHSSEGDT